MCMNELYFIRLSQLGRWSIVLYHSFCLVNCRVVLEGADDGHAVLLLALHRYDRTEYLSRVLCLQEGQVWVATQVNVLH